MTIAFYYTYDINPTAGGTERVTYALSKEFAKDGISYIYIAANKRKTIFEEEKARQFYLPRKDRLACEENVRWLKNLISKFGVTVLINQDSFDSGIELCNKANFPGVKCITAIHYNLFGDIKHLKDVLKWNYISRSATLPKYLIQWLILPLYKHRAQRNRVALLQRINKNQNAVILLSQSDRMAFPVADKRKLFVIPNPVTVTSGTIDLSQKEKTVLYVGRLTFSQKRVDYLLKAWKMVSQTHPDWMLKIIGTGTASAFYKGYANQHHVTNVEFEGNTSPERYYQTASALCLTSTYEGFGLVLTEAMLYGTIPVAFDSYEAVHDIIDNGNDGLLVTAFNVKEYANTLDQLMSDSSMRLRLAKGCLQKVNMFDIHKIAQQWIELFHNIK